MKWKLYLAGGAVVLLAPTGYVIALALAPYAMLLAITTGGVLLAAALAGLRIVFAYGRRAAALARQAELTQLPNAMPIHIGDVSTLVPRLAVGALDRWYEIELARARGALPVSSPIIDAQTDCDAAPAQLSPPPAHPTLRTAQLQGWSDDQHWLIGLDAAGQPQQIDLEHTGMIALGGVSGSGKTNSAAWLAAQAAASGARLFVADPHYGDPDSLSARIMPFSGAVGRFAVTPAEINEVILQTWRIYDYRCTHPQADKNRIVLLIDELMELLVRQLISADALTALLILGGGARKKAIHGALISSNWSAGALGPRAQPLRQTITHSLVHRCSADTAKFLLPPGGSATEAMTLQDGQTIVYGSGRPIACQVPKLMDADRALAARAVNRPPRPYAAWGPLLSAMPATQPVGPIATPPPPMPPPTNQQRILALLADGVWRTHAEMAAVLDVDVDVIQVEAKDLYDTHKLVRRPTRRNGARVEYQIKPANQPTN